MPAGPAAVTFSLMPPTGSTRPRRLISPVMAVSLRVRRVVSSEISATLMATPAERPSLGVAPAGASTGVSLLGEDSPSVARGAGGGLTGGGGPPSPFLHTPR